MYYESKMPTKPQFLLLKGIFFTIFNWGKLLFICILFILMVTILSGCASCTFCVDKEGVERCTLWSLTGGEASWDSETGKKKIEIKHPLGLENFLNFTPKK